MSLMPHGVRSAHAALLATHCLLAFWHMQFDLLLACATSSTTTTATTIVIVVVVVMSHFRFSKSTIYVAPFFVIERAAATKQSIEIKFDSGCWCCFLRWPFCIQVDALLAAHLATSVTRLANYIYVYICHQISVVQRLAIERFNGFSKYMHLYAH